MILKRKCGQKNCKCAKGVKHASFYLSQSYKGKTKMTYIPKKYEQEIYSGVEKYKSIIKKGSYEKNHRSLNKNINFLY